MTSFHRRGLFTGMAVVLGVLAQETSAGAQGFALNRYEPSAAGDPFFGVASPATPGHVVPRLALIGDYAHAPLVIRPASGGDGSKLVSDQLFLHLNASLALFDRLLLNVNVPFLLATGGDSPTAGGTTFTSPNSAAVGDIRLGARVRLFGEPRDPLQIAFEARLWAPSGSRSEFTGDGRTRFAPLAVVGGEVESVVWTASIGPSLRPDRRLLDVSLGTELTFGAGVAVRVLDKHLQVGPELYGATVVGGAGNAFARNATGAELLLGAKYRVDAWVMGLGVGPGLGVGVGVPDVRALASVAYSPEVEPAATAAKKDVPAAAAPDGDGDGVPDREDACPSTVGVRNSDPKKNGCPPDRDGDGVVDAKDACPDVAGVASQDPKKNGCPPDRDADGIVDEKDGCPDVSGVANEDPKKNGCPPDRDGDGIADASDACPDTAGVANPDPKKNGCPPDRDGDGVVDANDACPDEYGSADPDPKKNGCPKVILKKKEIVILEKIHFEFGKSTIMADSDQILTQIANVLVAHPEIKKLEIDGHTDNKGGAAYNQELSQKRAEAVRQWLVGHGVEAERLVAKGFGSSKPIAPNATEDGREKNRRVEFKITDPKMGVSP